MESFAACVAVEVTVKTSVIRRRLTEEDWDYVKKVPQVA